jgi:adenosyl cobinamide kinase/adenosyl cobinamide phosphate guanylyltransferase
LSFEAAVKALHSACFAGRRIIFEPSHLTLVLGGVRSGKSRYAEDLMRRHPAPWVYIATAQALDHEMRVRISEHQSRRDDRWRTIEAPIDLAGAMAGEPEQPILVDCLTLWVTNLMLGGHDIAAATLALEATVDSRSGPTILVSNEVGLGIVPATKLGRSFRDQAGLLNQRMAARAGRVLFMVAGLPLTVK